MPLVPPCDPATNARLFQNAAYIGINVQNILYGVELVLYLRTMHVLLTHEERKLYDKFYAVFCSVMFLLITVWIATEALYGEEQWVMSSISRSDSSPTMRAWLLGCGTIAVVALQLMTDALMIFRCRIIWESSLVIIVPSMLWVATLILGILLVGLSSTQGEVVLFGVASKLGLAYYTITVFLNVMVTGAIYYHLVQLGKAAKHLGSEYGSVYFSVATLIIESMLPYTLSGIAFLVSFGTQSSMMMPFMYVYMMLMCLSSQILIFRVSTRKAWNNDTSQPPETTIRFSDEPCLQCSGESGVSIDEQTLQVASLPGSDADA